MKKRTTCNECGNDNCLITQGCFGEWLDKISANLEQCWYKKGSYIFQEGEPIYGIYILAHGGIKVVTTSIHGREQIVRLVKEGQIMGYSGEGKIHYQFNSVALVDSKVCFVDKEVFEQICMNNPKFAYNLICFYGLELQRAEMRVKYLAQMSTREKVAMAFLYHYEIYGINQSTKMLKIPLTRQELADIAGTTAEQVTRQLSEFERKKLIARNKRDIKILQIKGLKAIIKDYNNE
jgi:CRP/FNR family transcriptional regulator, cyclic AMP receptor protein